MSGFGEGDVACYRAARSKPRHNSRGLTSFWWRAFAPLRLGRHKDRLDANTVSLRPSILRGFGLAYWHPEATTRFNPCWPSNRRYSDAVP